MRWMTKRATFAGPWCEVLAAKWQGLASPADVSDAVRQRTKVGRCRLTLSNPR